MRQPRRRSLVYPVEKPSASSPNGRRQAARATSCPRFLRVTTCALLLAAGAPFAGAQNRGQYIPGAGGLNAGIQAPVGFTIGAFYLHYEADALKTSSGQNVPISGTYTIDGGELLLAYTTPWGFAGATYGAAIVLFYLRGQITSERFDVSAGSSGFADSYFEPINLGWALDRANVKVAYGFIAPTGAESVTTDFYGHDVTVAATFHLDEHKLNQISFNSVTEFHQKKRDTDFTVGDNTTLELGVGGTIPLNEGAQLLQLGVAGYGEWQFSDDKGSATTPLLAQQQDRVFAAGLELGVIIPRVALSYFARAAHELAARSRAEGYTVFTGLVKSF